MNAYGSEDVEPRIAVCGTCSPTSPHMIAIAAHYHHQPHGASPFRRTNRENQYVSGDQIDDYLAKVEEPKRSTLERLRRTILVIVPEAQECISYQVPAFRFGGEVIAGFAAFKNHLSYLPFSGSVLNQLSVELEGYDKTLSALHFPVDRPLPEALVKKLINVRLRELRRG
jgi:uncharacterized protein YdhG (YjbR/CyaY superfamily)